MSLAYAPYLATNAWCISGLGLWQTPDAVLLLLFPAIFILFPSLALPKTCKGAGLKVSVSLAIAAALIPVVLLSSGLRMYGFYLASERAEPVVSAIRAYETERGAPPASLSELVPKYIAALPERIPDIKIVSGTQALSEHPGNRWMLTASASQGILNWDEFMYLEAENYDQSKRASSLVRVGKWAYYHE